MGKRHRASRNFPGPKRGSRKDQDPGNKFLRSKLASISGGDHTLASNPLDALFGRKLITDAQREAGSLYASLRAARFHGKPFPEVLNWSALVAPNLDGAAFPEKVQDEAPETRARRIRAAFDRADAILRLAGSRAHSEVQNVACFGRWPVVMTEGPVSDGKLASGNRDLDALKDGLSALADHWGMKDRREAA